MLAALCKAGVPWEVANEWSPIVGFGFLIAAGEVEGQTFNWGAMKWDTADDKHIGGGGSNVQIRRR